MFQVGQRVSPIPENDGPATQFGFVTIARIKRDPEDPLNPYKTLLYFSGADGRELDGWGWYLAFPDESIGDDYWGWYAYRFAPIDVVYEPDFSLEEIGQAEAIVHGKGSVNHCGNGAGVSVVEHPGRDRGT